MNKSLLALLLISSFALCGCGKSEESSSSGSTASANKLTLASGPAVAGTYLAALGLVDGWIDTDVPDETAKAVAPMIEHTPQANVLTPYTVEDGCGSGSVTVSGSNTNPQMNYTSIRVLTMDGWEPGTECDGTAVFDGVLDIYHNGNPGGGTTDAHVDFTVTNEDTDKTLEVSGTIYRYNSYTSPVRSARELDVTISTGYNTIQFDGYEDTLANDSENESSTRTISGDIIVNGATITVSTPSPIVYPNTSNTYYYALPEPTSGAILFDGENGKMKITFLDADYRWIQIDSDEDGEWDVNVVKSTEELTIAAKRRLKR